MRRPTLALLAVLALFAVVPLALAGDLDPPPGPIAPTGPSTLNIQAIGDLPYTITQPGSYVLTSNLIQCSACPITPSDAITIDANNVTLDLNGFSLVGDAANSVSGIVVNAGRSNITIRHGIVRGFPHHAVNIAGAINSRVERLIVADCGADGIRVGFGSTVRDCNVTNCLGQGVFLETACIADSVTAVGCGLDGIHTLPVATTNGSIIRNCTARLNAEDGIDANDGCVVSGCTVTLNGAAGIRAATGCTISNNAATLNTASGIVATSSLVRANTALNNGAPNISATSSTLADNHAP